MSQLTIGQCATLSCLLEVAAPKPGNVHRGADFPDMTLQDLLASAVAIGPALELAPDHGVGATALAAIQATRQVTHANTNLGIVLLLAPLACVSREISLSDGIHSVLSALTANDCADVYQAIQLASPGGLNPQEVQLHADEVTTIRTNNAAENQQVADRGRSLPNDLLSAMRQAADWDLIAQQYVTDFALVFESIVPWLMATPQLSLSDRIVRTHVRLMSEFPDSLIARKCGQSVARESAANAAAVLRAGEAHESNYHDALADLDFWLRSDGNRRNPGTTADLIAAGLFVLLREDLISAPFN
ncbi:MAG: triphosphoribosyl-dephospho-CoA synthase [Planctomycetales bacterium]|nr:triphosphoribosyl-dephospho-CoA synthase [Planctomycetales bacterium]MCA9166480.1 triphosphoribosyl-dephospho-CoA synthase [Planctomycetales bacterium]